MIPNSVTYDPREIAQMCGLQPWQTYYDSEGVVLSRDGDTVSLIANAYRDLDLAELSELQRAIHSEFRRGWTNIKITKAGTAVTAVNFSQNRELTPEAAELHLRNYLESKAEKENHEND